MAFRKHSKAVCLRNRWRANLWDRRAWGIILYPLSLLFEIAVKLRNALYDKGVLPSVNLDARVISVGNITVGGTGKTPLVERLARFLRDEGHRVAVLSRGYGRKESGAVVVSDGLECTSGPEQAGDEPFLLARRLSNVVVVVGKNRAEVGKKAVDTWKCDVLLLDDGFQHRKLKRTLDIVVLDATQPWGNGKLLPAGPLREPLSALRRADAVIFTHADGAQNAGEEQQRIRQFTSAPVFFAKHRPVEWVSLPTGESLPLTTLRGKTALGVAGIGNPASFRKTLDTLGIEIAAFWDYPDHHWYSQDDLTQIENTAKAVGVDAVVTTEKDGVRFPVPVGYAIPVYYLKIESEIEGGIQYLRTILVPVLQP